VRRDRARVAGTDYDVVVVGARCAGSPTAMLLARLGVRVLLVDRARFPSDTVSTHLIHPQGVDALRRWGLLDAVAASGCPPIDTYAFDFGTVAFAGHPAVPGSPVSYCCRRTVLDEVLVGAAADAGAEVREGFTVEEVLVEDGRVTGIRGRAAGGSAGSVRARVVVGADGRNSLVARTAGAPAYDERPPLVCGYYGYWSGLPTHGRFETYVRAGRGLAVAPTNDDRTMVFAGWPYAERDEHKGDVEGTYRRSLDLAPTLAERLRDATLESPVHGTFVPNFFRRPHGPGWALVGDAGYCRDFVTAQGISDAFLAADACAPALAAALSGEPAFDEALAGYHAARDARVAANYDFTLRAAALRAPSEQLQQLLTAVAGDPEASDAFARVNAGVSSPAAFFSAANIQRVLARAG
jgi:flavin-dependent dehydrogenase